MEDYARDIAGMLEVLRMYGIDDKNVLQAMERVPRHAFIPEEYLQGMNPYADHPCPIGHGQTISQPFIVAKMVSMLRITPGTTVLEVGTGCGYQTAVLLEMGARVRGLEVVPELAEHGERMLKALGYSGFRIRHADGYLGWPEEAPFPRILVSCAPLTIPEALLEQLADPGVLVLPVGSAYSQQLVRVERTDGRLSLQRDIPVRFVPMVEGRDSLLSP